MKKYIVSIASLMLAPALAFACPVSNPKPVLQITKVAPSTVSVGNTATYGIVVSNVGTVAASNVVVQDFPPAGFTFVPAGSSSSCASQADGSVQCSIASIAAGANANLILVFQVTSADACPNPINRALIKSPTGANPSIVGSQCVTPTPTPTPTPPPEDEKEPGIEVKKDDGRTITRHNHTLTYTIVVTNTGDQDLHDVKVTDTVPAQLNVTDTHGGAKDGNNVVWHLNELETGASQELNLTGKVKSSAACDANIVNSVKARSEDHDVEDEASDTTEIECQEVKAAVVQVQPKQPVAVPVTARTGAGLGVALASISIGAASIRVLRRLTA